MDISGLVCRRRRRFGNHSNLTADAVPAGRAAAKAAAAAGKGGGSVAARPRRTDIPFIKSPAVTRRVRACRKYVSVRGRNLCGTTVRTLYIYIDT